ncbi:MAG TPA: hypothetical protein VH518_23635 [Tepidisphaeraceae bacterium]|jgi:hypothetical protein
MSKLMQAGFVVLIVLIVLVAVPSCGYNMRLSQAADQSWAQVCRTFISAAPI